MLFTSFNFIVFVSVTYLLYYTLLKKYQWQLLLVASIVFYALCDIKFVPYIVFTALSTYYCAKKIGDMQETENAYLQANKELDKEAKKEYKNKQKSLRNRYLILGAILNFGLLGIIKYTNFTISNINNIFGILKIGSPLSFVDIAMPLGISFYIFKSQSYLIDINRGKYKREQNFFKFALYVSFFPQIIQGPISRFDYLSKTLFSEHKFDYDKTAHAFIRIMWGFFKKLVIADRLLPAVKTLVQTPDTYNGAYVLVLMLMYTYQLYCDFTGGIDITIGVSQLFGIESEENFDRPYSSKNVAEFWRRWHMSMSSWFRDYIFYPISVSKTFRDFNKWSRAKFGEDLGKRIPIYVASIIVWFVTGLWHGSSWNFIVWGLLNGLVIIISQELKPLYDKFHEKFDVADSKAFQMFQMTRTLLIISSIRILDCYRDVGISFKMFFSMFLTPNYEILYDRSLLALGLKPYDYIIAAVGLLVIIIVQNEKAKGDVYLRLDNMDWKLRHLILASLFITIIVFGAYGVGYDSNQFIYNQF